MDATRQIELELLIGIASLGLVAGVIYLLHLGI
jgi:hypothetical protein